MGKKSKAVALAVALSALLVVPAAPSVADSAPVEPAIGATATADALPTVQIDGVAWAQVVVGNTVYVGGEFTTARPAGAAAGTSTVPRSNLLAYDLTTGELLDSWAPTANAPVYALAASPDGSRIYIGGVFNRINNAGRSRLAAVSPTTGALQSVLSDGTNGEVRAIDVASDGTVYIGGTFNTVAGASRNRVASFTAAGALRSFSANVQSRAVRAVAVTPDGSRVFIGGAFEKVNEVRRLGTAALAGSNGALLPWDLSDVMYTHGPSAGTTALDVDDRNVYGTAFAYYNGGEVTGNNEGAYAVDQATGRLVWMADCHGDTYSVYANPGGDHVYVAGHPHMCNNIAGFPEVSPRHHEFGTAYGKEAVGLVSPNTQIQPIYANNAGLPAAELRVFFPQFTEGRFTGQNQATWHVTGNDDYVVYGGEFRTVNGRGQQGLVRFAKRGISPEAMGPTITASALQPAVRSHARGSMQVSWPTSADPDNKWLTYTVLRDDQEVHQVTAAAKFWNRPRLSFSDEGLADGTAYTYRIRVTDASGNSVLSSSTRATTLGETAEPLTDYSRAVLGSAPSSYWRLGSSTGVEQDRTSWSDVTVGSGVTRGVPGALTGDSDGAMRFTGASNLSRAYSNGGEYGQDSVSIEAWFRTSTPGGKIVGFGTTRGTANSGSYDRHVYLDTEGRLVFGVHPGGVRTVASAASYADGEWHHVVATLGRSGMQLYADGTLVGSDPGVVSGRASVTGYWRIGGDALSGWPGAGAVNFVGDIDEVATYGRELTALEVVAHHGIGTQGEVPNVAPTASFTATGGVLQASVDASASSDLDGEVASYTWSWGDGTEETVTDPQATHTYAEPGTYTVRLTVTDDGGATGTAEAEVVVRAPNQAPVASFTSGAAWLDATFDGTTSSDPDGTVASHAWDFGDGTAAQGPTASHTYAEGGTYDVTLTVTDGEGATGQVVQQVTVEAPPAGGQTVAADAFERQVSAGWGTADVGGAWSVSSGTGSVADGVGVLRLSTTGQVASARLPDVSWDSVDVVTTVSWQARATGSGAHTLVRGRITPGGEYRLKTRFASNGTLSTWLVRATAAGAETRLSDIVSVPGTYTGGTQVRQRLEVDGTAPTTLRAKVWMGQEPTTWLLTVTDATAGMQVPGHTGLAAMVASNATGLPAVARFDDLGVTVPQPPAPPNQDPVAAFDGTVDGAVLTVDGSASADPDGQVVGHQWSWGDGTPDDTGSGATASHTFAAPGTYEVTLTVTDDDGARATTTRTFVVEEPAQNAPPVAAFTAQVSGATVAVDASTSSDPEGGPLTYRWDWGDGTAPLEAGATATYTYGGAQTYQVTLTVVDGAGASSSVTVPVTVAPAPASPLLLDDFARDSADGWGELAGTGPWSTTAGAASVSGGTGRLTVASAGGSAGARLPAWAGRAVVTTTTTAWDARTSGGGGYTLLRGRITAGGEYRLKTHYKADGTIAAWLARSNAAGAETTIAAAATVPGMYTAGTQVFQKLEVSGVNPTTVRAKVWTGTQEPEQWQWVTTDATTAMQADGHTGVAALLHPTATAPLAVSFDDFALWAP